MYDYWTIGDFGNQIVTGMLDFLLPYRCPFCKGICKKPACARCLIKIEYEKGFCLRCGYPHAVIVKRCVMCNGRKLNFTSCCSLGFYAGFLKDAIHAIKFERRFEIGKFLVKKLLEKSDEARSPGYQGVVYVPASQDRLSRFGFDQSLMLARMISDELSLPVLKIVKRKSGLKLNTKRQTLLTYKERKKQAAKKFEVEEEKARFLKGKEKLLLVDDVITTGSTVSSISGLLRRKGVKRIHVLTLAHTPQGFLLK